MRLLNIRGRWITKNVSKYVIDWDGLSKSKIQFRVKQFLKPHWHGHICFEEFPVYGTMLRVDLLNATMRIAVEVQGQQHSSFHYFHNGQPFQYLAGIKNDMQKMEWLQKNGFKLIEVNFDEIDKLSRKFFKEKFGVDL
jgi:hypothetical protein